MNNIVNVQEIRRNVINVVRNYSDAQVKVRKATSNEPWGPSATLMSEIADLTYNVVAFSEIMQIIWKRLNDHGKNWRHVYKALVLLEYLIKTGSEKVAQQCRDNLFAIQTLKDFQYFEESKDQGLSIREKSKLLVNLLKDEEKLKVERARALKAKERFTQSLSYMGNGSDGGEQAFRQSSSYPESLSQSDNATTSRSLNSDLESARPQTAGEEKLQLELALAMSKEEAEQEERLRKNDDLRLKLALEESEKNAKPKQESHTSAVDELLSLATPGPSTQNINNNNTMNGALDPWGSPITSTTITQPVPAPASLLPSPPMNNKHKQQTTALNNNNNNNDPWSTPVVMNDFDQKPTSTSFDDLWAPSSSSTVINNDPWSLNNNDTATTVSNNDPWNSSNAVDHQKQDNKQFGEVLNDPVKTLVNNGSNNNNNNHMSSTAASSAIRRTPESFLGPNSNLVNLDALVSSKVQTSTSPNNNPFASSMVMAAPAINPFQANKPSQPTINELRAQNNLLGISGGPSPVNNMNNTMNTGAMNSLFNNQSSLTSSAGSAFSQQTFAPIYPQLPTSTATNNNSVWGNFPQQSAFSTSSTSPQPNNPFAM